MTKTVERETGCLEWTGSVGAHGYGQYRTEFDNPTAHRMMWETFISEIPAGQEVHHSCENPLCVNPFHLLVLSKSEHWALGNSPSAVRSRQTHCQHGHPFDSENTYVTKRGHRRCRTCHRERERQRRGGE